MVTVINNPGGGEGSDSFAALVIGLVVAAVLTAIFIMYGLPMIEDDQPAPANDIINVDVQLPPAPAPTPTPTAPAPASTY